MKNRIFAFTLCLIGLKGFSQNIGYDEAAPGSKISIHGNLSVGASYSSVAAPTSGAIIQGVVGIGTSSPTDQCQVNDGSIGISNDNNTAGTLKFYEPSTSGANYMAFKAGVMASSVTYTLPTADGTSGQVLSTNGSGTLSWATASGGTVGKTYSLPTPASSDPNSSFSIGYTETGGEVAVTISTVSDVIRVDAYFSAIISGNAAGIRVTRSQTAGSGTVGTVVGYSANWNHDGTKYANVALSTVENSFSATGTWYYKFWILTGSISSGANYNMVITKEQ